MDIENYIEQFQLNNYDGFDDFYKITSKRVYFTALNILKQKEKAEDIVQETYISFLENIDSYKKGANVFAYLTVIARNKSINVYNRDKRISLDEDKLKNVSYQMDENVDGVEKILSLLKDSMDREIVVYHVLYGYKFKEIAEIIDMPLGTVLWRYNKAIKNLKKGVTEYEN